MANTTKTQVTDLRSFYDKDMLAVALPHLVHNLFGQVRDIPTGMTDTIKFRRYDRLSAATTALTEGITPTGSQLSVTDVNATVNQYGDFITTTDVLQLQTEDPLILEMNARLGEQAGDTFDQLCRDIMVAGTTVQYASTATARNEITAAMKISNSEIKEAIRTLKNNDAKKITSMIDATDGVSTYPINSCFVGIVHPNTTYDLKADSSFVKVEEYASTTNVMPGEVGKLDEVRFIETTNAKVFSEAGSGSADVYATLIIGSDAYGISRISGNALTTVTKPLGSGDDPLNQRATHGWKGYFTGVILNESWMLRLEHGVTG